MQMVPFTVRSCAIPGLTVLQTRQAADERGTVREFFRASAMTDAGLHAGPWQQINVTRTSPGALRGLHGEAMTKLIGVVSGAALGAYVDLRVDSPVRGRVVTVSLTPGVQVLVPPGVCNGYQAVGPEPIEYLYAFDREWVPGIGGVAVHALDPALGIEWPVLIDPADRSKLSAKDAGLPLLADALG
ncbi:dTDP-4-dehydrorhamnose 3,5-epimerase [Crossiella sp. CA-258035]|uniref:dTDP-4-dehydrorhamnose 3,5-epimerase family protein n=1 Tax=Crossiella sp. CA-258035 TaxID=2981138 RepID=UPI0024BC4913|nr:dTDP-4-dehydrorhamnose 3,5-epimerase [Crossiella sp. CA-258035]WHT23318.1 dTDP-4-dehydrorhamnose 3,5-epimerase [Crossiella sp. CA-258035]